MRQSLQAELKKKKPFESLEQEAFLNMLRTTGAFFDDFEKLFKNAGLSSATYNVLRILRGAGGEGLPCLEIAHRLINRLPDITRLVDRLESQGLVKRARINEDRRVVLVRITDAGRKKLDTLDSPVHELHMSQMGHMTRSELSQLNRLLVKARHGNDASGNTDSGNSKQISGKGPRSA